jgi:hypothetical protein
MTMLSHTRGRQTLGVILRLLGASVIALGAGCNRGTPTEQGEQVESAAGALQVDVTNALQSLAAAEKLAFLGSCTLAQINASTPACSQSILKALIVGPPQGGGWVADDEDQLILDAQAIRADVANFSTATNDFANAQSQSLAATGFTFVQRLELLSAKLQDIANRLPSSGILNNSPKFKLNVMIAENATSLAGVRATLLAMQSGLCSPLASCSGVCADLQIDVANCGACGHACGAGKECAAGVCICPAGQFLDGASCSACPAGTHSDAGATSCTPCGCSALDQCHDVGACDPVNGACSNPSKADGTACNDGNSNTVGDVCTNGSCAGVDHCVGVTCSASDQCHVAGTCDHATGACSNPAAANDTACNDGNACTQGDSCQAGACVGGAALDCNDGNGCTDDSCNPATGCVHTNNTASCDDGNACTTGDTCHAGACVGGNPVTCAAPDQCHSAGTCNPSTGCSNPSVANGTACDDGNAQTTNDVCTGGVCAGVAGPDPQWAQWPMPSDGGNSYTDNGDGTVKDNVTGLIWDKGTFDVSATSAYPAALAAATAHCAAKGGSWRVPTLIELESLIDASRPGALDPVFTPTSLYSQAITATPFPLNGGFGYGVWFGGANVVGYFSDAGWYVRCLENGPPLLAGASPGAPANRYSAAGGVVTDSKTGLHWEQTPAVAGYTWAQANSYCAGLTTAGGGWRLPTLREQRTLLDPRFPAMYQLVDPVFQNQSGYFTWSASLDVATGNHYENSWSQYTPGDAFGNLADANPGDVRCVRSDPPPDPQWAQWPMPSDGGNSYTDNGDGTVKDNVTGLVWDKGTFDVSATSAYPAALAAATAHCAAKGGSWRVPTLIELESLIDASRPGALDPVFTPTSLYSQAITATPFPLNGGFGYGVWFGGANVVGYFSDAGWYVRCLANGPPLLAGASPGAPANRYSAAGGVVTDSKTGLHWEQTPAVAGYTWAQANSYCAGLTTAGGGWRLPTLREQRTLLDPRFPAMYQLLDPVFQNQSGYFTWSASLDVATGSHYENSWSQYTPGNAFGNLADWNAGDVRCVR